jgi:hypothetical protein
MSVKINKRLNLVIPLDVEGGTIYVHSTPIKRETFERYYMIIGQAFNAIHTGGLGIVSGARLADLVVKDLADKQGNLEGDDGVQHGLLDEIVRLTNVFAPGKKGWDMIPLDDAVRDGVVDEDDAAEVRSAIVFFMLVSSLIKKSDIPAVMTLALRIWGGQLEPLSSSDFLDSLRKLNETANSTAKIVAVS